MTDCFVDLVSAVTPFWEEPDWDPLWQDVPARACQHVRWDELVTLIAEDPVLNVFYEEFSVSTGTGMEQGWDAQGLALELVSRPWQRLELGGRERTAKAFATAAVGVLDDLRELAAGGTVQVPARFMFDGPQMSRRFSRDTAFGRVCWTTISPPYVGASHFAGLTVFTRLPLHLLHLPDNTYFYSPKYNQTTAAIDRFVSQFRVALLSRAERDDTLGPPARVMLVQLNAMPVDPGNYYFGAPAELGHGGPVRDLVGVCDVMERYQEAWDSRVDTAARRLGQAMARSTQEVAGHTDEDALVDAMIALESMFTMSQELSFRLSTAVAHLLGDTPTERDRLYRRLKKLYGVRSSIVHGNVSGLPDLIGDEKDDAIRTGIRVLEKLLFERRDLLTTKEWEVPLVLGTSRLDCT